MTAPAAAPAARRAIRPLAGTVRQTLRLTRTEFVLFYRYRMALYVALLPVAFLLPAFITEGGEIRPGVDAGAYFLGGAFPMLAVTVGIVHVSNVYAARRESMILKRFRLSGVAPAALFGATTLSVLGVVAVQSAAVIAVTAALFGTLPADPVLLVASIVLVTVTMSLLGAVLSSVARNAESAQMISMIPFFGLLAVSGLYLPAELLPGWALTITGLLPMAPAVDLARSAYFGRDFVAGADGAVATGIDLWLIAAPGLAVLLAWTALSIVLLRFVRWDPRRAK
ncbi:ABC transporter permease [Marinactinospora rubrisoli]|uniref:ABC transporter permease n=1 Tax=Marinactinospora rubrisoli TaxID=2715399 RepID=A0ABW2KAZ6_9ACTN